MSEEVPIGNKMNIYEKICKIMGELHYIHKGNSTDSKNEKFSYTYASHDAVTARVQPLLVKYKVVIIPTVVKHETETVIDKYKNELKFTIVTLKMTFVNAEDKDDRFDIETIGYGIDSQDKGIGKAKSYAYKYGLLKQFCLETGDDPEKDLIDVKQIKVLTENEVEHICKQIKSSMDPVKTLKEAVKYYKELNRYNHDRIQEFSGLVDQRIRELALLEEAKDIDSQYANKSQ